MQQEAKINLCKARLQQLTGETPEAYEAAAASHSTAATAATDPRLAALERAAAAAADELAAQVIHIDLL